MHAPSGGLLAAVHGLQIGKVVQLEGDPDGEDVAPGVGVGGRVELLGAHVADGADAGAHPGLLLHRGQLPARRPILARWL